MTASLLLGLAAPGYAAGTEANQTAGEEKQTRTETATASEAAKKQAAAKETAASKASPSESFRNTGFENDGALPAERTGEVQLGTPDKDGGVAEIVSFDAKTRTAYVVNGQAGVLNAVKLEEDGRLSETASIDVKALMAERDPDFAYGDMTSVFVDAANRRLAVALQAEDYRKNGRAALLDLNGQLLDVYETGVQPDMITGSKDGSILLTANEGEPREGYGEGTEDPRGSVSIIDTKTGKTTDAGFAAFDAEKLAEENVLIGRVNGTLNKAVNDLEPEYIALDEKQGKAYFTLQEANAIATLDLDKKEIVSVQSVGFADHGKKSSAADFNENGAYGLSTYGDDGVYGVRMPDGISLYQKGASTYLLTANEGDAREWGEEDTPGFFLNEAKQKLTADDGTETEKKVRVLDQELVSGLSADNIYTFGSRSFTIFDAKDMHVVFDSGSAFEQKTGEYLPDYFNASNDDIELDSRSAKKGPEPESIVVGEVGTRTYAFIALERIGGVMIYDITAPEKAAFVNYINTRDFSGDIEGDVAPEGLCFINAKDSGTGMPVLLAACEVSGTLAAYSLGAEQKPATPSEPEKPATPSEPDKPATPSEPENPQKPNRPSNGGSSGGGTGYTGKTAYQPDSLFGNWIGGNGMPWKFRQSNGTEVKNSWGRISGKYYHFDQNGIMQTGWFTENGRWYYLGQDGAMLAGTWVLVDGKWYALNLDGTRMENQWYAYQGAWYYLGADGVMLAGTKTPDGYTVSADGSWKS